jgi:triosephosphate isomerase
MEKLIVGNWKMQKLFSDIHPYFKVFKHKMALKNIQLALAVPSIFIKPCLEEMINTPFILGAQDVSEYEEGAYTGEVSAVQLASMPVTFSLVGHSERRQYFHETSAIVLKKAQRLQAQGLFAILCVGETLEQKKDFKKIIQEQLKGVFTLNPAHLVVAYEPVWAIGTGQTATLEDIKQAHLYIKSFLSEGSRNFSSVKVLYGGSVNESNASSILSLDEVGGLLIGGASLNPSGFEKLIEGLGPNL